MSRVQGKINLILLIFLIMICATGTYADNSFPEAISGACSGIVCVKSVCMSGEDILEVRERTGFFIGEKGYEPNVITTADKLEFTNAEKKRLVELNELSENAQISSELYIVFQGDVEVAVTVLAKSDQKNLAVLKLNQTLTDKYTLEFSGDEAGKGMAAYLLSFRNNNEREAYGKTTVAVDGGSVLNKAEDAENGTQYFSYNMVQNSGTLGGPVLSKDGCILGMNVQWDKNGGLALSGKEIIQFLELHNVHYAVREVTNTVRQSKWPAILGGLVMLMLIILVIQIIRLRQIKEKQSNKK